jgi:hypothetical protein
MEEKGLGGVFTYFDTLPYKQREAALVLHTYLLGLEGVSVKIRYGVPFYDAKKMMCYIGSYKHVIEISFLEAKYLTDEKGLLQWRNRKSVASIALPSIDEVDWEALDEVVKSALLVDSEIATKKKKPSILWGKQR